MDLANMRSLGVTAVDVTCRCGQEVADVPTPDVATHEEDITYSL
jgi:hypothetical protein